MSDYHHSEELREWIESETAAKAAFVKFCVASLVKGLAKIVEPPATRDPMRSLLNLKLAEEDALDTWKTAELYSREREGMYLDACRPGR